MIPFYILFVLTFLLCLLFLMRLYLIVVTVESESMAPTLQVGERVLAFRYWHRPHLTKGQIILFYLVSSKGKLDLRKNKPYVKRVIGLPGETLGAEDVTAPSNPNPLTREQQSWYIPEGHIFVRGDNRYSSLDSLSWGPVPIRNVFGRVLFKLPRRAYTPPPLSFTPSHSAALVNDHPASSFVAQTITKDNVDLESGNRVFIQKSV